MFPSTLCLTLFPTTPYSTFGCVCVCVCGYFKSSKIFVHCTYAACRWCTIHTKHIFCIHSFFCLTICTSLTEPVYPYLVHTATGELCTHTSFSLLLFAEKTLGIHFKSVHQHLRYNCNTTYGKTQAIVLNWSVSMLVNHRHSFVRSTQCGYMNTLGWQMSATALPYLNAAFGHKFGGAFETSTSHALSLCAVYYNVVTLCCKVLH